MDLTKEVKAQIKQEASAHPEQFFPVKTLQKLGFSRHHCETCGTHFWSQYASKVCGDPKCSGGFRFLDKKIATKSLTYTQVWQQFAQIHKKLGYTPLDRYPVVSRWNPTMEYTIASVAAFQPFVVSGEVEPPANPLVIPQFCLRFNDVDSVGLSGHFTGFVMLGELAFMPPAKYDKEKYVSDYLTWLNQGMGLANKDITIHEDAWGGGGNFGCSLEFFSGGLEIGNQVYMTYLHDGKDLKPLNINVLDMGAGQERAAWFTQGKGTSYDATFPHVMKKLYEKTDVQPDPVFQKKFMPYSSYLNMDEVEDAHKVWDMIGQKMGVPGDEVKWKILPLAALYSIADHTRSLLFALHDGGLPSNVGGGYNLRMILRRALSFISQYGWSLDLGEICEWHAEELKDLFPELSKDLDNVQKILAVEAQKYKVTQQKTSQLVQQYATKEIDEKTLLELYDSQGIAPELIQQEAKKLGKIVHVPENFYAKVSERHEHQEQKHQTTKDIGVDVTGVAATKVRYFEDYKRTTFSAKVVKSIDKFVILDETFFYATGGGQLHDTGSINGKKVVQILKQGNVVLHELDVPSPFHSGETVKCLIDWDRRLQLSQHHTAAHIVNAAARQVLGPHINQASAYKDIDKGRLDITHYQALTDAEVKKIEDASNAIVAKGIQMRKEFMSRDKAEKAFGMGIYQGGVPPGKELRIVEIPGVDVECCGGSHLDNTKETGMIKIIKTSKISDGIVRLEYTAGKAAQSEVDKEGKLLEACAKFLGVKKSQVPGRATEIFNVWKDVVKKGKARPKGFTSKDEELGTDKDVLERTASILKTQPEHVLKTLQRFVQEIDEKH